MIGTEPIDIAKQVEALAQKAEDTPDALKAMQFSQAALNVANAMRCINE